MTRLTRRSLLAGAVGSVAALTRRAATAAVSFDQWIAAFRDKAVARGVADDTYTSVMNSIAPDTTGLDAIHNQPEFTQALWQYLNRVTSDWRVSAGKGKAKEYASLFARIEKDYGVTPNIMLGIWGIESAFGDPIVAKNHMRPVIPSLATLAWGEPRRRGYWEQELINALSIVQHGWAQPPEMVGSWAGAMGHTQWMPEVWLHLGLDYDGDGKISPYGPPDDALATTARYFVERGDYRRDEAWGHEVRLPAGRVREAKRTYAAWEKLGVKRADGGAFPAPGTAARLWVPVAGGPAFLLGTNFYAVKSYNPSTAYALGLCHLGDVCSGGGPFVRSFPDSEPAPTLADVQEIQQRLTALGFDTGGADGRIGNATVLAVQNFQRKMGVSPADGYAGVGLLARLRKGS